jgi:hypothetical protein
MDVRGGRCLTWNMMSESWQIEEVNEAASHSSGWRGVGRCGDRIFPGSGFR